MGKLGDRLKRPFQLLSRSTTPEPPPDLINRPEPPANIVSTVPPTPSSSTSDTVVGAPATGTLPILSPQPIIPAAAPITVPGGSVSHATWTGLKLFVGVLGESADVFGPLKHAVDAFAEFIGVFETSMEAREEYKTLRTELDGLFLDLAGGFGESIPPGMRPSIVNLARGIEQEISFFRRKEHKNTLGRFVEASQDVDQVLYRCRRIQALLERLTLNANVKIWMLADDQATNERLRMLSPSHAAWYSSAESEEISRDECTPDTRLEVLERFRVWQEDSKSEKVYWLNGMAGTGKTTLAYTLCKQLEDTNRLAANFFCTRQLPSCRDTKLILPTIAYQLANFSYPFRYALSQILDQNRDVQTRRISEQFEKLLYKPLHEVKPSLPYDLVVVIDGLDECDNDRGVGEILDILFKHVSDMPIKFFLTSRPEPAIRGRMLRRRGDRDRFELHLHELDKGVVREDVKKYLQAGLKHPDLTLSNEHLGILTERSGVLFIYAATVVRYIGAYDFLRSNDRLKDVLEATTGSNESDQDISSLYNLILKRAFGDPRLIARERDEIRLVLETVICAREPLTVRVMASVLGLKEATSVHAALGPLRSVLNVQRDQTITTLHKSFPDHMLDPIRSPDFGCDPKKRNRWLARRCFDLMTLTYIPPFHECDLDPLCMLDDMLHLDQTLEEQLSGALFYACQHWATHLRLAERPEDILDELRFFLLVRLLLSMEVVNLTMLVQPGVGTPSQASVPEWAKRTGWCLVAEAVAVAISLKQYYLALEWFEQGRSILLGQTPQLQTPYDDLYAGNLEMLMQLQRVLYQPKCLTILEGGSLDDDSWKRRLTERRKELLDFARLLPKLGDTLYPPKASKLVSLVEDGAAVIVNLDHDRCDALVIQAGTQAIAHVPLIGFSIQKADGARAGLEFCLRAKGPSLGGPITQVNERIAKYKEVLAGLWHDVTKPVLDKLGITLVSGQEFRHDSRTRCLAQAALADDLPHITWCTTGPLSFLPLHAAGDYGSPDTILPNLVISSYTPTLSFLSRHTSSPGTFSGVLTIGHVPPIHRFGAFSSVKAELDQVQVEVQANRLPCTRLDGENASTDAVLKAMANHSWAHFACPGSQNTLDLMNSSLCLHDGHLDLATIARNPIKNPQLAFLSSREVVIEHPGLPNVPVPLAVGLLMAGYPTVITTMLPIVDENGTFVAVEVYRRLLEGGVPDTRNTAKALHNAVASLRKVVGVDEFQRWLPYVHIGR